MYYLPGVVTECIPIEFHYRIIPKGTRAQDVGDGWYIEDEHG